MIDPFLAMKWIHILSSTVLFGTGIGTAFQMVWAWRTGRVETIHSVASGVVVADWLFTTPAGIVQPVSGLTLVWMAGYDPLAGWLIATYVLYLIAFGCWVPVVGLQMKIRDDAARALSEQRALPALTRRRFWLWFALGWPAFASLVIIFWLMIAKPGF